MDSFSINKSAEYLINCRKNLKKIDLTEDIPKNEKDAYIIQNYIHKILNENGDKVIGRKIGCTTKVMQDYLHISHPCAGTIREKQCYRSGIVLDYNNYQKVGVECELAIRLSKDIHYAKKPNIETLYESIKEIITAIEIVDDRYSNWKKFNASYLIADDFFSAGCVLGNSKPLFHIMEMGKLEGEMLINGIEVGRGRGNDILGNPISALSWLVSRKDIIGEYIPKGQIILLGSLVQTKWLNLGDLVQVNIKDIGSASVSFK
mgnify:CR=1 FL=1|tara:strand:+ start:15735 stop:16517 length:783 start_codon:yes stop_codon:yes gene_type:complete